MKRLFLQLVLIATCIISSGPAELLLDDHLHVGDSILHYDDHQCETQIDVEAHCCGNHDVHSHEVLHKARKTNFTFRNQAIKDRTPLCYSFLNFKDQLNDSRWYTPSFQNAPPQNLSSLRTVILLI